MQGSCSSATQTKMSVVLKSEFIPEQRCTVFGMVVLDTGRGKAYFTFHTPLLCLYPLAVSYPSPSHESQTRGGRDLRLPLRAPIPQTLWGSNEPKNIRAILDTGEIYRSFGHVSGILSLLPRMRKNIRAFLDLFGAF